MVASLLILGSANVMSTNMSTTEPSWIWSDCPDIGMGIIILEFIGVCCFFLLVFCFRYSTDIVDNNHTHTPMAREEVKKTEAKFFDSLPSYTFPTTTPRPSSPSPSSSSELDHQDKRIRSSNHRDCSICLSNFKEADFLCILPKPHLSLKLYLPLAHSPPRLPHMPHKDLSVMELEQEILYYYYNYYIIIIIIIG